MPARRCARAPAPSTTVPARSSRRWPDNGQQSRMAPADAIEPSSRCGSTAPRKRDSEGARMRMSDRGTRVARLAIGAATLLWLGGLGRADAQVYRWTDDSGQVHVTDDLNQVPAAQRERLRQQPPPPASPQITPQPSGD